MKNFVTVVVSVVLLACAGLVFALDSDLQKHPSCTYCGMDRAKFSHSRVMIDYDDGSSFGACSLHCAAVDLAVNIDKTPKTIRVGDYASKNLIDAERAVWVVGGSKPGVMTGNAKWAFEDKGAAQKFIAENGGVLATFDEAMKTTYQDMYNDTKRIRERRALKKSHQPKGSMQ